ncbi:hypothetical protein DAT35_17675 [Vitiosangium sp. GDMCC 1.1324]|nr:hypothetical protein DAT35_17675 [Vitiosangium sp. GDMCC 1.1324]
MMLPLLFTAACGRVDANSEEAVKEDSMDQGADSAGRCTLAGCSSGFELRVPIHVSLEKLRTSTVSVCHNTLCYTSGLETLGKTNNTIHFPDLSKRDAEHTPLIVVAVDQPTNSGLQLQLSYDTWSLKDVQDGDAYDVTLTDEHGEKFVEVHETVSYQTLQPNGPQCAPTCWRATIDKT